MIPIYEIGFSPNHDHSKLYWWMDEEGGKILSVITYIIYKGGDGYTSNRLEGCLYTLKDDQRYLPKTKENIRRDI